MPDRRLIAAAVAFLTLASPARAATPTILVKFKQPATAATRIKALGDDAVGQTANRVSIVRPAHGESVAARIAAYDKRADVLYAERNAQMHAFSLHHLLHAHNELVYGMPMDPNGLPEAVRAKVLARIARAKAAAE